MRLGSFWALLMLIAFSSTGALAEKPATSADAMLLLPSKDPWIGVSSRNFLVVGDASGKQLRRIAVDLEEIRRQFMTILPKGMDSHVRTTVIVFRNDKSFAQFRRPGTGYEAKVGYVQAGVDRNYIVLNAGEKHRRSVYHDYIHLLLGPHALPTWLREGLSEYFGSVENQRYMVGDSRTVLVGFPIYEHEKLLRDRSLLPMEELLEINDDSPLQDESNRRSVFLAESWALVHLIQSRSPDLLTELLQLLMQGTSPSESLRRTLRADSGFVEAELRDYIHFSKVEGWAYRSIPYCTCESGPLDWLQFNTDKTQAYVKEQGERKLSPAEIRFHLGDLLLHRGMLREAETLLQAALALDSELAGPYASFSTLRMQQGRLDEAQEAINRALSLDSDNPLPHFWYAKLINGDHQRAELTRDQLQRMQRALLRAVRYGPHLDEAVEMLIEVNLLLGEPEQSRHILRMPPTGLPIGSMPGR